MTDETRCAPPPEFAEALAPSGKNVVHVPNDAGGIYWRGQRYRLDALTPPATVAALVDALEQIADAKPWTGYDPSFGDGYDMATESAADTARAALALYRGEAGR